MTSYPQGRYLLHTCGFRVVDVRTNRYKARALLRAPLAPIMWLVTWLTFKNEKGDAPEARPIHRDVLRTMHRGPLLFGEATIPLRGSGLTRPVATRPPRLAAPAAQLADPSPW